MRRSFQLQPHAFPSVLALWWCCASLTACRLPGGEFRNLRFDDGDLLQGDWDSPHPGETLLPGWTVRLDDRVVDQVYFNDDVPGRVSVYSAGRLWGPMIEGRYGARLGPGMDPMTGGLVVAVSISQVGLVPSDSRSLYFKGNVADYSEFSISLNGVDVPYLYVMGPPDNAIFSANIEGFGGQEVELRLTGYESPDGFGGGATIDSLTFSPSTVPEPSTWTLLTIGGLALLWRVCLRHGSGGRAE